MSQSPRRDVQSPRGNNDASLNKREYKHQWYINHRDEAIKRSVAWNRTHPGRRKATVKKYNNSDYARLKNNQFRRRNRKSVIEYYSNGNNVCACCREGEYLFLTIDHINGGGNKERKELHVKGGHHFYAWLKKNNYPEGYQVLCFNCNQARGFFGYCPHTPL